MADIHLPQPQEPSLHSSPQSSPEHIFPPIASRVQKAGLPILQKTTGPISSIRRGLFKLWVSIFFPAIEEKNTQGAPYLDILRGNQKTLLQIHPNNQVVTITTSDGVELNGMVLQPQNPIVPPKYVILAPGNDTSIFHDNYQYWIQAYLERGIQVMAFDYREVGLSNGTFSTKDPITILRLFSTTLPRKNTLLRKILWSKDTRTVPAPHSH